MLMNGRKEKNSDEGNEGTNGIGNAWIGSHRSVSTFAPRGLDCNPQSFKPPQAVSIEHLLALRKAPDLSKSFHAAAWALALTRSPAYQKSRIDGLVSLFEDFHTQYGILCKTLWLMYIRMPTGHETGVPDSWKNGVCTVEWEPSTFCALRRRGLSVIGAKGSGGGR